MSDVPDDLVFRHRLRDGTQVAIRPIRREDADLERRFIAALSDQSRYFRFQKWVGAPSDTLIRFLTGADCDRHVALGCTLHGTQGEELIGQARFVKLPGGAACEFGIIVADAWHGSGVAGLLMAALLRAARARGIETMEGLVMRSNVQMLRFARALGFRVESYPDDLTQVRVVKELRD